MKLLALLLFSLAGLPASAESPLPGGEAGAVASYGGRDDGRGTPYHVNKVDNICGLDEPRQLTNPAAVDYAALLGATPEMKKIAKEKIDPTSSEGITLTAQARSKVLSACESVRQSGGHCSVWKTIRRRDKKAVSDVTDAVKRLL
ncbi:MAG: hypothetical protein P8M11_17180 [Planctomycetota bacterium]|nr:hypothetical protein [Planctomycetota bacterium]